MRATPPPRNSFSLPKLSLYQVRQASRSLPPQLFSPSPSSHPQAHPRPKFRLIKQKIPNKKRPQPQFDDFQQLLPPIHLDQLKKPLESVSKSTPIYITPTPSTTNSLPKEKWSLREELTGTVKELIRIYKDFNRVITNQKRRSRFISSLPEDSIRLYNLLREGKAERVFESFNLQDVGKWTPYILAELSRFIQEDFEEKLKKLKENTPKPGFPQLTLVRPTQLLNIPRKVAELQSQFGRLQIPRVILWTAVRLGEACDWMLQRKKRRDLD